jgi:hypothetical protein
MKRLTLLLTLSMMFLLGGCASVRRIDSDVTTVVATAAGQNLQGARYRFERLPSQLNNPEAGLAEQQAEQAMAAVGMVRDDAHANLSVLVGWSSVTYVNDPFGPWGSMGRISVGRGVYPQVGVGMNMRFPPPNQYRREVSLVMRDLRSGQVVYETRASHDGPWADSLPVFATLFQAAMAGFPNPPASPRKVFIDIPR